MATITYSEITRLYADLFVPDIKIKCGKGWSEIIADMCLSLDLLVNELDGENYTDFKIESIESKFGVLKVDYNFADKNLKKIIDFAERLSYYTCEMCGEPGKIYCSNKWLYWSIYKTLRQKCITRYNYSCSYVGLRDK